MSIVNPETLKSNAKNNFKEELKKIKEYIKNPRDIGLWETTFSLSKKQENSVINYIKSFFNRGFNQEYNINTLISDIYYIQNPLGNQKYDISDDYKSIIDKVVLSYHIDIEENILRINGRYFFILPLFGSLKVLSLTKEVSTDLEQIMENIGYATVLKKEKIFSPKETLFLPYLFYTNIIKNTIFPQNQEITYINEVLNFNSNTFGFEEQMRIIGKAFESTLTHIYETLLRKDASNISSNGKLLNSIESEIQKMLYDTKQKQYTPINISKEINTICQKIENENSDKFKELVKDIKELAKNIKKQEKSTHTSIIFPNDIQLNIKKVQELRNQVSHHNTTISTQENLNTMFFSYIQIYLWWQEALQSIKNWDGTQKEIIEEFIKLKNNTKILEFTYFLNQDYIPPPQKYII